MGYHHRQRRHSGRPVDPAAVAAGCHRHQRLAVGQAAVAVGCHHRQRRHSGRPVDPATAATGCHHHRHLAVGQAAVAAGYHRHQQQRPAIGPESAGEGCHHLHFPVDPAQAAADCYRSPAQTTAHPTRPRGQPELPAEFPPGLMPGGQG